MSDNGPAGELSKLGPLHDHDILVLRTYQPEAELASMEAMLRQYLERAGLHNVILITLAPHESLRHVDEEQMRLNGWCKMPAQERGWRYVGPQDRRRR